MLRMLLYIECLSRGTRPVKVDGLCDSCRDEGMCCQESISVSHVTLPAGVFLDCIEQFNLMVNSKGSIVHSELKGTLQMKAYLSGMPECKLGLNDKTMFARQVCIGMY